MNEQIKAETPDTKKDMVNKMLNFNKKMQN
jgi:hypothetical protein